MSSRPYYGAIRVNNDDDDNGDNNEAHDPGERAPLLPTSNTLPANESPVGIAHQSHQQVRNNAGHQHDVVVSALADKQFKTHFSKVSNLLGAYWSDITFDWISPLIQMGNVNGQLNLQDLDTLPLPKDCETNEVYAVFSKCWKAELDKAKNIQKLGSTIYSNGEGKKEKKEDDSHPPNEKTNQSKFDPKDEDLFMDGLLDLDSSYNNYYQPSLIRALYNAFGADFLYAGLLKLVHDSCLFVGPQVLNRLIRFLRDEDAPMSYGLSLMLLGLLLFVFLCCC